MADRQSKFPRGSLVVARDTDQTDHIRGVKDGDVGEVIGEDQWHGAGRDAFLARSPLVRFPAGDLWMAMHQLELQNAD